MINWIVKKKNGQESLIFKPELLIQKIISKKQPSEEHEVLAKTLVEQLEIAKTIGEMSIYKILTLGVTIGYYYRIFMEKNDVEVEHVNNGKDGDSEGTI